MIDPGDLPRITEVPGYGVHAALESVIIHMRRNVTQTMNLGGLAKHVDLNPFYLSHLFRKHVGISAKRYHQLVRISSAKQILAITEMKVTDVSLECGYDSLGSFITTFKRTVGLTPTEFRRGLLTLDTLSFPDVHPRPIATTEAISLNLELVAPIHFVGCAFVAICDAENGVLVNCTATTFKHQSSITFPVNQWRPLTAFAVAYSANTCIRDAIIGEPALRARCDVTSGPAPSLQVTLNLREAGPVDSPFVAALPLLARHRASKDVMTMTRAIGESNMLSMAKRNSEEAAATIPI
jgi:AraC-like DNA-binding protein